MSKYVIRPTRNGFGIYNGRTIFGHMRKIAERERLWEAENAAVFFATQDYHKQLDYRRLTTQVVSTDMMDPIASEEHIYTALVLAGKKPVNAVDEDDYRAPIVKQSSEQFDNILEPHLGKPISYVARTLFEERFMTWYGQQPQNADWIDPRREREYIPNQDRMGRNRYSSPLAVGAVSPGRIRGWLDSIGARATAIRRALFGPAPITAEQMQRAADAMNHPQSGIAATRRQ